jgi:hypothetical protein
MSGAMAGRLLTRVFVALALAAAAYVAGPLLLRHQRALQQAAHEATGIVPEPAAEGPEAADAQRPLQEAEGDDEAAPPRTYYRYIDGGGTLRFVESLEAVPEPFRASAKPLGMGSGGDAGDAPSLNRAQASRPKRRRGHAWPQPPAAARAADEYDGATLED